MNQRTELLSQQLAAGETGVLGELLQQVRERLLRIIDYRLDSRLQGRLDPEDVFQELCIDAARRLGEYQRTAQQLPAFVWLRFLAVQKTIELNRKHVGVAARSIEREISLHHSPTAVNSTVELANRLMGREPTPSEVTRRNELAEVLSAALQQLDAIDREILELRHYEQLSNEEAANVLGISSSACSNRYVRALKRLKSEVHKTFGQSS
ncbi:MAG TPA: sigma-70 family RNA polymerase sigma factor [Pirellulaceae bacterium]|mgnify:FL=1|nr:sigma-70 family RNA polymerase sigma factor [Pirellulaceae bacterium]HMO91989.1 sigma-70 family RNA polymerase sigma factor [Pirellulaceae bacterium]HMP68788.1 sigma-70 family RNA polymerase sigma factor [Pirellulaceae bacterium]